MATKRQLLEKIIEARARKDYSTSDSCVDELHRKGIFPVFQLDGSIKCCPYRDKVRWAECSKCRDDGEYLIYYVPNTKNDLELGLCYGHRK